MCGLLIALALQGLRLAAAAEAGEVQQASADAAREGIPPYNPTPKVWGCGGWVLHPGDAYRPIPEVLKEHPGVDGYCYFEGIEVWIWYYGKIADYESLGHELALGMREGSMAGACSQKYTDGTGPLETATFDAGTVSSHIDCEYYHYDDLYFYSLGWLRGQRLDGSKLKNATAWEELAAQECQRLDDTYHFRPEELSIHQHGNSGDNLVFMQKSICAFSGDGNCEKVTSRDFALHVYAKCLLGIQHAAEEMAYSYMRACLTPGNVIKHGPECIDV